MNNKEEQLVEPIKSLFDKIGIDFSISACTDRPEWDYILALPEMDKRFFIEVKNTVYPQRVKEKAALARAQEVELIILTSYVSKKTFNLCKKLHVNIVSAEGNAFISSSPIHIDSFHEVRKKPKGTSGTVFSPKSSRVVRALLCFPDKEWTQKELVESVSISQSQISKVLRSLEGQGFIVYDKIVKLMEPERLLMEWAAHYRFDRHKKREFSFSSAEYKQGLQALNSRFAESTVTYCFTGWSGAYLRAPYGINNVYMAYISGGIPEKIEGLYPSRNGNVNLYEPQDEGVFQFVRVVEGINIVSDVQLYLDLYRMPGRAEEQAQHLKDKLLAFTERK